MLVNGTSEVRLSGLLHLEEDHESNFFGRLNTESH